MFSPLKAVATSLVGLIHAFHTQICEVRVYCQVYNGHLRSNGLSVLKLPRFLEILSLTFHPRVKNEVGP